LASGTNVHQALILGERNLKGTYGLLEGLRRAYYMEKTL
jgi:hypothetical protein